MQFLILLIGVLVFAFYQFNEPPIFFNRYELNKLEKSSYGPELETIKKEYSQAFNEKQERVRALEEAIEFDNQPEITANRIILTEADQRMKEIRKQAVDLMEKNDADADTNDNNYIFLSFVTRYLPQGLIGLLIAIIFLASMGSTASALNSLTSTTVVDIYKRHIHKDGTDRRYLGVSRLTTMVWGVFCILMALYASKLGNLIEAVNILGSLFYGTILGIFLVAFYFKKIGGTATFIAALVTEVIIFGIWWADLMAFLWLNVVGCVLVISISYILELIGRKPVRN